MSNQSMLPEVLLDLADKKQSGVFRAQKANARKQLIFKEGVIAFSESNQPNEHLAHIMVSMGLLKKSDLREVISLMKQGNNSEEAVSSVSCSGEDAVDSGVCEQVIVVLSSLLGWDDFEMRFFPGEDLIKNRRNMRLKVPEMLVSSARRAVSKRLVPIPKDFLQGVISADKTRPGLRTKLPLNDAESYAYIRTHDNLSAAELLPLISDDDSAPEEVLLRLHILGLLGPENSPVEAAGDVCESADSDGIQALVEEMLARFESASLYEILSVKRDADINEIQSAYYDLARRFHPDRFQSDSFPDSLRSQVEQVFSYINEAYMTLKDPDSRARYEQKGLESGDGVAGAEEGKMIEALFRQGRKSLARGDFEKAAKELNSCVYLRPDNASYYYYLGLAESEIPRLYKNAEQHLLKAIELERISIDTQIALAKLYLKVNLPRKAARLLKELLRLDPDNPEANKLFEALNP